jgi:hypothetical protein
MTYPALAPCTSASSTRAIAAFQTRVLSARITNFISKMGFNAMGSQHKHLVIMYCLMLAMCAMMVFWIFVFPATFRASPTNDYGKFLERTMSLSPFRSSLLTKYKSHPAVQFLHILPAGAWSLCIPLQLTPSIRKSFPMLHKLIGWSTVLSSSFLFLSVFIILHRKLDHIHSEYALEYSLFIQRAGSAPTLYSCTMSILLRNAPYFTAISAVWFMFCIIKALRSILRHDTHSHRIWMMRHVGSGLGVAAQRCFVLISARDGMSPTYQMLRFTEGIYVGFIISVAAAELAVGYVRADRSTPGSGKVQ